jgi:hypothetical protein
MNTLPTEAQLRLIEQTYDAFKDAPRPRIDQITSHSCWECDELRDLFNQHSVREVPDALIQYESAGLGLMTPIAFRYYLPRYIAFSILPDPRDSFAIDTVLYSLGPEKPEEPYWLERLSVFSRDERRAIANYIATRRTWDDSETIHLDRAEKIWGPGIPVV